MTPVGECYNKMRVLFFRNSLSITHIRQNVLLEKYLEFFCILYIQILFNVWPS